MEQPIPKVGEIAKYRTIDLWNNTELSTFQSDLLEIKDMNLITRAVSSTNPKPRTVSFDRNWNPCRKLDGSDQTVCDGAIKFPLQLGGKHEYKEVPTANGKGHNSANCLIKGEEKVTVAAGTFDTVRIECSGFWKVVVGGSYGGRGSEVSWYAPAINRLVKWQFFNWRPDGTPNTKTQTELVEFIPAK